MEDSVEEAKVVVQESSQAVMDFIQLYGLSVLGAVIILIIGFWFSSIARNRVHALLIKTGKSDEMLSGFLASIVKYLIIVVTVLAVLNKFGFETTSLVAILGAASLAIGLALQGTLSNVSAGVMLLFLRPFSVGHFIEVAGHAGSVKAVTLFSTELATGDNVQIIIPNSAVWGSSIKNYSANDTRRVDLTIGISYEDDIDKAMALIEGLAKADTRIKQDPAPVLAVGELADSSVNLVVRLWVDAADYWGVRWDMTKTVKTTFDDEGISIPYPQQVVHHVKEAD